MSINGIGVGYPAWREAGETRRKHTDTGFTDRMAGAAAAEGNFVGQAARAAQEAGQATVILHGAEEGSGDITIFSGAEPVIGSSYSVYKTADFDPENPVYKVKIWDQSGNVTQQMVDVSKVDPKNCNAAELYAYTADLKESGKGSFEDTVLKAVVAKAVKNAEQKSAGSWSFSENTDWVKIVKNIMQSEYRYGDLKGYAEWREFLGFLEK